MTIGAWLWSERRSTITGRAAAALHGAKWVDETAPIELLWRNNHAPPGIIARNERFAEDEVTSQSAVCALPRPREPVSILPATSWVQRPSLTSTISPARRE